MFIVEKVEAGLITALRLLDAMEQSIDFQGEGPYRITKDLRDTMARDVGWAYNTMRMYMNRLEKLGHLGSEMSGREKIFILSKPIDSIRQKLLYPSGLKPLTVSGPLGQLEDFTIDTEDIIPLFKRRNCGPQ